MSKVLRTVGHCDKCHHEWFAQEKPLRCAKCKKSNWDMTANTDGDTLASPMMERREKTSDSMTNEEILRRWRELGA